MSLDICLFLKGENNATINVLQENITHNLAKMWKLAGMFDALYNSDGKKAREYGEAMRNGLMDMEAHPEKYRPLSAENGWGTYDQAMPWIRKVVAAFLNWPDATIAVYK